MEPNYEQFDTLCKACGGQLYVRGFFYISQIPFNADGFTPQGGDVQDPEEDLEVYCTTCDFSKDMDAYVAEQTKKE